MSTYSVVEAKNRLSQLIDLAQKGEEVVITRHGQPVVVLKPVQKPPRPVSIASLDWLAARRIHRRRPESGEDAGTFVSRMRDEEDERF